MENRLDILRGLSAQHVGSIFLVESVSVAVARAGQDLDSLDNGESEAAMSRAAVETAAVGAGLAVAENVEA